MTNYDDEAGLKVIHWLEAGEERPVSQRSDPDIAPAHGKELEACPVSMSEAVGRN
jgi:hypothetical protein